MNCRLKTLYPLVVDLLLEWGLRRPECPYQERKSFSWHNLYDLRDKQAPNATTGEYPGCRLGER